MVGTPILCKRRDIFYAGMLLNIPFDVIKAGAEKVFSVNNNEFSSIRNNEENIAYVFSGDNKRVVKTKSGLVFIGRDTPVALGLLVLFVRPGEERVITDMYIQSESIFSSVESYHQDILHSSRHIRELYETFPIYRPIEWGKVAKYAKKLKLKMEINDNNVVIKFPALQVGNDVEGRIKYKGITIYFDKRFHSQRVIFYLKDFCLDSDWNLPFVFHPHINSGRRPSFCFGNRTGEIDSYRRINDGVMLLDAYTELVHSYSPEGGPYASVTKIAHLLNTISALSKKVKLEDIKDESYEDMSRRLVQQAISSIRRCNHCSNVLNERGHCITSNCPRNPTRTDLTCPVCGQQMVWSLDQNQFVCPGHTLCDSCRRYHPSSTRCPNPSCSSEITCPHCGEHALRISVITDPRRREELIGRQFGIICATPNCPNNPEEYDTTRPEIEARPTCRHCGRELTQNTNTRRDDTNAYYRQFYHNWFCNRGCNPIPQYDRFGFPLNTNIFQLSQGQSQSPPRNHPSNIEYNCPECDEVLSYSEEDRAYWCNNDNCPRYEENILDENGDEL